MKRKEKSLVEDIKEIAAKIYDTLGSGFTEDIYQRALEVEFRLRGLKYEAQKPVLVFYEDHCVGDLAADLLVWNKEEKLLLELKVLKKCGEKEEAQLRNYLLSLDLPTGLLINFCFPSMEEPEIYEVSQVEEMELDIPESE